MYNTILFDLDGTLVPMAQEDFVKNYFGLVVKKVLPLGVDKDTIIDALWKCTKAMVMNDGKKTNYEVFWSMFPQMIGKDKDEIEELFIKFYLNEFDLVKNCMKANGLSRKIIDYLKGKGYRLILSTNSLFPKEAIKTRLSWVDLVPEDFEFITTYDKSSYCKPNPLYFKEIVDNLNIDTEKCLMVGNNAIEDMCAGTLGIDTYLVTDFIEDGDKADITKFKRGSLAEFYDYIKTNM